MWDELRHDWERLGLYRQHCGFCRDHGRFFLGDIPMTGKFLADLVSILLVAALVYAGWRILKDGPK